MVRLFNRHWWWTTLLVIAAVGVMIRLGIWQLDRLEQRRAFNAHVNAQFAQTPLDLTAAPNTPGLSDMEYRSITVTGQYDHSQEVALRNHAWENQPGVHLLTPLVISGTDQAVLVERGWVPAEDDTRAAWAQYAEPGLVTVNGMIRASRSRPDFGGVPDPTLAPGETMLFWNNANVLQIDEQVSYDLVPIYIQQAPDPALTQMPYRNQPTLDLSEGSHLGYAFQWFTFATILAAGYPFYVRYLTNKRQQPLYNLDEE